MAVAEHPAAEPVIASSDRFRDIESYVYRLFEENPKLWGQVLPWEFPQNGTKDEEEEFLRRFFDDREIYMQGGADGEGRGFRFLKQVWYSAALWNIYDRLPMVVDWWFKHNQDLQSDPNMRQHMLKPDVKPSTFFQAPEVDMYGEKFLGEVIKQIQFILSQSNAQPTIPHKDLCSEQMIPASASAKGLPREAGDALSQEAAHSLPQQTHSTPADTSQRSFPSASGLQGQRDTSMNATTTARPHPRTLSNGDPAAQIDNRHQVNRHKRGAYGNKRGSLNHNRGNSKAMGGSEFRPAGNSFNLHTGAATNFPSPAPGAVAPLGRVSSGEGNQGRHQLPSMPVLPRDQPFPTFSPSTGFAAPVAQYGPQFLVDPPLQTPGPIFPPYQPGQMQPLAAIHGALQINPSQISERSNNWHNGRPVHHEGPFHPLDEHNQHRPGQRRDSISSRGGNKSRGHGGSLRGRGARGRNSFSHSGSTSTANHSMYGYQDPAMTGIMAALPQGHRRGNERFPFEQVHQPLDENSAPINIYHGGDARAFGRQEQYAVPSTQRGYPQTPFNASQMVPANAAPRDPPRYPHDTKDGLCTLGCDESHVAEGCTTATQVALFNTETLDEAELKRHLNQSFGGVKATRMSASNTRFVTFESVANVRACLAANHHIAFWPDSSKLQVALARGHFDRSAPVRNPEKVWTAMQVYPTPRTFEHHGMPPPPPAIQGGIPAPKENNKFPTISDNASDDTTPTVSGANTPGSKAAKKKVRKQAKKQREAANPANATDQSSDDNAIEHASRQDSIFGIDATKAGEPSTVSQAGMVTEQTPESNDRLDSHPTPIPSRPVTPTDGGKPNVGTDMKQAIAVAPASTSHDVAEKMPSPTSKAADNPPKVSQPASIEPTYTKPEDEPADDSFHTASGSPDLEKDVDLVATSILDDKTCPVAEAPTMADLTVHMAATNSDEETASAKPFASEVQSRSGSLQSVNVKQPAKSETHEAPEVVAQGGAPGSVGVAAPDTSTVSGSKSRALGKKGAKQKEKGPEQTESLSIFSNMKTKKPKTSKQKAGGSLKRKGKSTLVEASSDGMSLTHTRDGTSSVQELRTPEPKKDSTPPVSDTSPCDSYERVDRNDTSKLEQANHVSEAQDADIEIPKPSLANAEAATASAPERPSSEIQTTRRPTITGRLWSGFLRKSGPSTPHEPKVAGDSSANLTRHSQDLQAPSTSATMETGATAVEAPADVSANTHGYMLSQVDGEEDQPDVKDADEHDGLAVLSQEDNLPEVKPPPKGGKGKKKKTAAAAVVEMNGSLIEDQEIAMPLAQHKGIDSPQDIKPEVLAENGTADSSLPVEGPPHKVKAFKKAPSGPSHLVEGRVQRRKHKRITSSKGGNSLSSSDEMSVSTMTKSTLESASDSGSYTKPSSIVVRVTRRVNDNEEQQPSQPSPNPQDKLQGTETFGGKPEPNRGTSPGVEQSKSMMAQLKLAEDARKAAKGAVKQ